MLTGANTHKIRFVPNADYVGSSSFNFKAWDKSSGTVGGTANVTGSASDSPFSNGAAELAFIAVTDVDESMGFTLSPPGKQIMKVILTILPLPYQQVQHYTYNYDIDWDNDGIFDELGVTGDTTHDFGAPGTYTVQIRGDFPFFNSNNPATDDRAKLISINQWGAIEWQRMANAFSGASNMNITATDAPNLSSVTSLSNMFPQRFICKCRLK